MTTGNNFLTRLRDAMIVWKTQKIYFFVLFYCPLGNEYQKGGSRCDHA